MRKWRIEDSEELYNIKGWGVNYFGINDKGHAYVRPKKDDVQIDLADVMEDLSNADITAPVLLRFPDILNNRIEKTAGCFAKAEKEYDYKGEHFIVYPIKVNQMRPVVEEIISHGKKYNLGLECGSKPELHAVLATNMDSDSIIVCNGHKDQNFIELALLAQKMGKRVFLVIEKLPELDIIARTAEKLGVRPNLGIRIKLASRGTGKWEESGGDASKFGLNSTELLQALNMLEELGLRDCFKLIHFHIGSQITKIRTVSIALREMAQYYVQLRKMDFGIEFVDCGGGLGVDYDGTRSSNSESSVNYSVQEYVNDIVYTLSEAANENGIPHPNIITEGGRSLTPFRPDSRSARNSQGTAHARRLRADRARPQTGTRTQQHLGQDFHTLHARGLARRTGYPRRGPRPVPTRTPRPQDPRTNRIALLEHQPRNQRTGTPPETLPR